MRIRLSILLLFFVPVVLTSSCAAAKSKRCNCPTFGKNKAHGQLIAQPAKQRNG